MNLNENKEENNSAKISIGMPIRNAGNGLEERLKSILSQSYENFELIISDNDSNDLTSEICKKFTNLDKRIRYHKQSENIGLYNNWRFVFEKAKNDYFVWASDDDIWHYDFLKENLDVLLTNKDYVCSISKIVWVGPSIEDLKINSQDSFIKKIEKKVRSYLGLLYPVTTNGDFKKRLRKCLKKKGSVYIYGLFRTEVLRKVIPKESFLGVETAITLGALKYGNFFVLESELFQKAVGKKGASSGGMIRWIKIISPNNYSIIFPVHYLNLWLIKNLGIRLYLRNIDAIISMFLVQYVYLFFDVYQILKKRIIP